MDLGDGAVEAQAREIFLDLDQRRVRHLADVERRGGKFGRRRCAERRREPGKLVDEAPGALDEFRRALHAGLGPDHVAFGRRIGEHDPARRIGAIGLDDLVGIDRVALRLRHFFDRADLDRCAVVEP